MSLITLLSFLSMHVGAQTINSATDLKNFYMKYLSEVYDPFTLGYFEDDELIKQSIVIKEKSPKTMYEVSFKVHEYSNKQIKTVSLFIYVEGKGKIYKIVRSSDNMTIEDTQLTHSTSDSDGTTKQTE